MPFTNLDKEGMVFFFLYPFMTNELPTHSELELLSSPTDDHLLLAYLLRFQPERGIARGDAMVIIRWVTFFDMILSWY